MSKAITGGCHCGAIRYSCAAEPITSVSCSCDHCKVFYGGAISAALVLPRAAVEITGEPTYYDVVADSGQKVSRGFCATCGTQVFGKPGIAPDLMAVTAGSIDERSGFKPQMHVYQSKAWPWLHVEGDIVTFPEMPTEIPEI